MDGPSVLYKKTKNVLFYVFIQLKPALKWKTLLLNPISFFYILSEMSQLGLTDFLVLSIMVVRIGITLNLKVSGLDQRSISM